MNNRVSRGRKAIVGTVVGLSATALSVSAFVSPASAHDGGRNAQNVSQGQHLGSDNKSHLGASLYGSRLIKLADGSFMTVGTRSGSVSAISGNDITVISVDGTSAAFTVDTNTVITRDKVTAPVATIVVGDLIRVRTSTIADVTTVTSVSAKSTTAAAGEHRHGDGLGKREVKVAGELVSSTETFKQTDGSYATVRQHSGTITAADATTITVTGADNVAVTYTIGTAVITRTHATALATDLVVGDHVRIEGTVAADVVTLTRISAESAADWAAMLAARAAHEAAEAAEHAAPATAPTTSGALTTLSTQSTVKVKAAKATKSAKALKAAKALKTAKAAKTSKKSVKRHA